MRELSLRQRHPVATGLLEGLAMAALIIAAGAVIRGAPLNLVALAVGLAAFTRPVAWQAAFALAPCLAVATLSDLAPLRLLVPVAVGLAVANLVARTEGPRAWSQEHGGFVVLFFCAHLLAMLPARGLWPALTEGVSTLIAGVLLFVAVSVARAVWTELARGDEEPSLAGVRQA